MGNEINRDSAVYFDNGVPLADGSARGIPHRWPREPIVTAAPFLSIPFLLSYSAQFSSSNILSSQRKREESPPRTPLVFVLDRNARTWMDDRSVFERAVDVTRSISYRSLSTI